VTRETTLALLLDHSLVLAVGSGTRPELRGGAVSLVVDARRRGLLLGVHAPPPAAAAVAGSVLGDLVDVVDSVAADAGADADAGAVAAGSESATLGALANRMAVASTACVLLTADPALHEAADAAGMRAVRVEPDDELDHAVDLASIVTPATRRLGDGPMLLDGWVVIEDRHDPDQVVDVATSHLTGNGYLGYRGTLPEWSAVATVGCTVSDTWDNADGKWSELCNVPNALFARFDGPTGPIAVPSDAPVAGGDRLERRLDVRYGRQHRVHVPGAGSVQRLEDERFASMAELHLLAQRQRLVAAPGTRLTLTTGIDGQVWSLNGDHFATCTPERAGDGVLALHLTTTERGLPITVAHAATLTGATVLDERVEDGDRQRFRVLDLEVGATGRVTVEQVMTVHSGNDVVDPAAASIALARRARDDGYEVLLARHAAAWDRLWERIDVRIDGDPVAQAVLRYNLYHNVIATPMHADHLPIGARGLSCQAYQGAAFWDQEVFNLPMWLHTVPEVARGVMLYRHRTLDGARRKAARLGYRGAFYAWISGDTGDELCPDFFFVDILTGRPIRNHFNDWQMHIAPDIATTVDTYVRATGDEAFLAEHGAEIVFEVARFLASFVYERPADGAFHLIRLLGPDEYHENVDDNVFSLEQSRAALQGAVAVWDRLAAHTPEVLARLRERLALTDDERAAWADIAARLQVVAPDPQTGLIEQFTGYFALEDITPDALAERLQHPDEYWGWPNGIAVHTQVLKQADVIQLFVCQPELHDDEVVAANLDHYLPRTKHASSLSRPMYGLVAARLGRVDEAYELFLRGATVDLLADSHAAPGGTFIGGIHTAACGATWQVAVLGFAGVHVRDDRVEVAPRLPAGWDRLRFGLAVRGSWLTIDATPVTVAITAAADDLEPVTVAVHGEVVEVAPGQTVTVPVEGGRGPARRVPAGPGPAGPAGEHGVATPPAD
jgi:1,2-alpha-glucosylglycerol phosphorylase